MAGVTTYTPEIASAILAEISTTRDSLATICKRNESFPSPATVYKWLIEQPQFSENYARAKEEQLQILADELVPIADTPEVGEKIRETKDGPMREIGDMIEHRKLQIDTRKWLLSKLAPKKYGDKISQEHSGPEGGPIKAEISVKFVKPE